MYNILIVDDEENIRKALIKAVDWEELGFNIVADASNGIEALDYIEKYDLDLLVTDIKMPIMGGIELARAAREIRPSMQIVFLSGHEQFVFAKQAIKYNILEYILKPITEEGIKREFSSIKQKLDEKFLEILNIDDHQDTVKDLQNTQKDLLVSKLINRGLTKHQMEQILKKMDIKMTENQSIEGRFVVFVVTSDLMDNDEESEVKSKRLFNISKIISEKYLDCMCTLYYDSAVIIAYGSKDTLDKYLPILSKDILMSAKRVANMKIYFGQSNYYQDIMQTNIAYEQSLDALIIAKKEQSQIVHIKDIVKNEESVCTTELFTKLEQKILAGESLAVKETLDVIFYSLDGGCCDFNLSVLQILSIIFKTCGMIESEVREEILKSFSFNVSHEKLKEHITMLCLNITSSIVNTRQKSVDNLANNALEIIENEYYDQEISLSTISERIHCSPNYLSSVIKKATGQSFVDVLTKIRMEKANYLLVSTNKKIREISEECGYANQHYFSYSFKKYFDKSPNTLRKELSGGAND